MPTPDTGTGPGWDTTLPQPAPPVDGAPAIGADAFIKSFDDAIRGASTQAQQAKQALDDANARLAGMPAPTGAIDLSSDARKAAELAVTHAQTILEQAMTNLSKQQENKGIALSNYVNKGNASPGLTAHYQALADQESAAAADTKAKAAEWLNTAPERAAQLAATTKETRANASLADAKAVLASATLPDEIARARQAVEQAQATLESTQAANKQAGLQNTITAATAAVAPRVAAATATTAEAGATRATAEATTAQANASVATQTSAATLAKAQTDASKAALDLQNAQAQFDATTPEMRTGALQASLDQAKANAQTTQEALKLAQDTHGTTVQQGQATLAQTQATTQQGLLGPLYGAQQKAAELTAMLKAGTITDPAQAHQMLQDYITSAMRGTTPYQQQKDALDAETTRRGQDSSLAGTQSSAMGSFGASALGSMLTANRDAPAGSNAMAQSYGGVMGAMMGAFQGMRPQTSTASPLLNSMSTGGGVTPPANALQPMPFSGPAPAPQPMPQTGAAPPMQPMGAGPAPSTTIAPDGTVTIQHTPQTPLIPPTPQIPLLGNPNDSSGMGAADAARQGQIPSMFQGMGLGLPHHVDALWANDPNLNPRGAPVSSGAQTSY